MSAVLAAVTAALFTRVLVRPRRRLSSRLRPYVALGRSRLGSGTADASVSWLADADDRPAWLRILGPSFADAAHRLLSLVDAFDGDALALRHRQAGLGHVDPVHHRMRQLAWTVAGLTLGIVLGAMLLNSVGGVLLLMVAFGFPASTRQRNRLDRAIAVRRSKMRSEVYTVTQLIAVRLRTGHGPVESIRAVTTSCSGPVADELREALDWISSGVTPQDAYARLAAESPEPAAARLYRLLAASAPTGGDIAVALLAVGSDQRAERRDEIARMAVKRRTVMVVPLLLLIAPVMVLFIGAALPSLVLGPLR